MSNRTHDVTLIDTGGDTLTIPLPKRIARQLRPTELFDVASYVSEFLTDDCIDGRKANEQAVEEVLRFCL